MTALYRHTQQNMTYQAVTRVTAVPRVTPGCMKSRVTMILYLPGYRRELRNKRKHALKKIHSNPGYHLVCHMSKLALKKYGYE